MTVDMNLPTRSFTSYLVANQRPPLTLMQMVKAAVLALTWLAGLIVLIAYARLALQNARLRRAQTVVAQYGAPDKLTPGQIGLMVDGSTDMKELTATIIDLAVRGVLKITRVESKTFGLFTKVDYRFDRLTAPDALQSYEQTVYAMLFAAGSSSLLSEIAMPSQAQVNRTAIKSVKDELGTSLRDAGYYGTRSNLTSKGYLLIPVVGTIMAPFGLSDGITGVIVGLVGAGLMVASFVFLRLYPQLTEQGAAEWAKVEGLKLYLSVAEKDRLNFSDAPERTPEHFNALLPYAVALGVEKKWAKQFDGLDVTPANGWYGGAGSLNSVAFAGSFAGSLASSINSSFSASGGAGGAGGGGGGGGGGGW